MPRGYWSIGFAALVAAILLSFGLGAYWVSLGHPEQPNWYPAYKSSNSVEQGSFSPATNVAAPIMKSTPCHNPKSETESDLCAQWRAAKAAEKSADWTLYGVIASAIGISLLLWQIMLTREAVKDTGDATTAMQESNKIAREGMERQLRAYVNATKIVVSDFVEGDTPRFVVEFFNAGCTPAKDVMVISQPFFFAGGDSLPKVRFKMKHGSGSKLSLASNQPMGHECPLNAPLKRHQPIEIASGEVKVIYAGIASYKDVFGKRHFTTFKAILDLAVPSQNGFRSMTVCSTGNTAS